LPKLAYRYPKFNGPDQPPGRVGNQYGWHARTRSPRQGVDDRIHVARARTETLFALSSTAASDLAGEGRGSVTSEVVLIFDDKTEFDALTILAGR
jgi:hypothetical protein